MSSSETPTVYPQDANSTPSRLRPSGNSLKRPREQSNISLCDIADELRPKTRRVNPERLATRLDPRLVAEMDALIVPGAKMPNFTIRKDFQERYCVDRRHIYDYFHSRGLRVAKEDKHNNLLRGRLLKARSQAAMASGEDDKSHAVNQVTHKRQGKRTRPRDGTQIENMKFKRRRTINSLPGPTKVQSNSETSSLSPMSGGSSNESPEPEFTMADEISDSTPIRAYTDADTMNSTFDHLYSSYDLSQIQSSGAILPNNLGYLSLGGEYTSFNHLDYYEPRFFVHDDSLVSLVEDLGVQDKLAGPPLMTEYAGRVLGGDLEVNHRPTRCQDTTTTDCTTRDDDIDFSRWLLTAETQDDESPGTQTKSTIEDAATNRNIISLLDQGCTRAVVQQPTKISPGRSPYAAWKSMTNHL
ncbi:hypothetical protein AX15_004005 [Amanita polypyramis BW_CC]|nr:hypothetical protein AX15_004005 [Amanita polypyramis BW_CC]